MANGHTIWEIFFSSFILIYYVALVGEVDV